MLFFVGVGEGGDLDRDIITTVNLRQKTKHMNIETYRRQMSIFTAIASMIFRA
jgi:hypothetical protein